MNEAEQAYIEKFGLFMEEAGLGQTVGRVLGWLMICNPPQQTLDEICDALAMSKSTMSTTLRLMTQFNMVERVSLRGERKHYYQMKQGFWLQAIERSIQQFTSFKVLAQEGLMLMEGRTVAERERLLQMQDLYGFLVKEFPQVIEKWQQTHPVSQSTPNQPRESDSQ